MYGRWILKQIVMAFCLGFLVFTIGGVALAGDPFSVFVSILPQKYFVERIAGDEVEISVMVRPGADPATYEPSPRQMADLTKAKAYFGIGVPFETAWLDRIQSNYPGLVIVDTQEGITLRQIEGHHHSTSQIKGKEPHAEHLLDPHIWLNPLLVRRQGETIYKALAAINPPKASVYFENYQRFAEDLEVLDNKIRGILDHGVGGKFMVFHPAWGYFADAYGLQQIPIELAGKEPSARELAEFIDVARREQIKIIFVQSQFNIRPAQAVAKAVGAKVVQLDPLAEDYMVNMIATARAISEALE